MSVIIPFTFVGGTKARAAEVNANFGALRDKFTEATGGISDGDIASDAAIKGSKISSVGGNRIQNAQLDDDAVDARVLKDMPGGVGAAVALTNHISDNIITAPKLVAGAALANLAAATVALDKLKVTVHSVAWGGIKPLTVNVPPSVAFAVATYELVALYPKNVVGGANVRAFAWPNDSGAGWTGVVHCDADSGVAVNGFLTYVFINRVS